MFSSVIHGEVIKVQEPLVGQGDKIFYTVEAYTPTGDTMVFPNCQLMSEYGGLGDYRRRRLRARLDAEYPTDPAEILQQSTSNASVGERVVLAFINNSPEFPVILGCLSHPNHTEENIELTILDPENGKTPQEVIQYNGVRTSIDDAGNYRIIRKGAPEVTFEPKLDGVLGVTSDLAGAASLAAEAGGEGNPALSEMDPNELSAIELLEGGIARIKDYSGGSLQLSPGDILLSNKNLNTFQDITALPNLIVPNVTTPPGAPPINEYVHMIDGDGATNIGASTVVNVTSGGTRVDTTFGNESQNVYGQLEISVFGSITRNVGGAITALTSGDYTHTIGGHTTMVTAGDWAQAVSGEAVLASAGGVTIAAAGDLRQSSGGQTEIFGGSSASLKSLAGAGMKASGASIAIGSGGVELFAQVSDILDKLSTLIDAMGAETHDGNLGYPTGIPINKASYDAVKAQLTTIKGAIDGVKGSL